MLQDGSTISNGSIYKESTTFAQNPTRLAILDAAVQYGAQKGIYFEVCEQPAGGAVACPPAAGPQGAGRSRRFWAHVLLPACRFPSGSPTPSPVLVTCEWHFGASTMGAHQGAAGCTNTDLPVMYATHAVFLAPTTVGPPVPRPPNFGPSSPTATPTCPTSSSGSSMPPRRTIMRKRPRRMWLQCR